MSDLEGRESQQNLAHSTDEVCHYAVAATVMGFDLRRLPIIARGFGVQPFSLGPSDPGEIEIALPGRRVALEDLRRHVAFRFRPSPGWVGYVELDPAPNVEATGEDVNKGITV